MKTDSDYFDVTPLASRGERLALSFIVISGLVVAAVWLYVLL
jgi:hypothetical protein